jgi:hypothetical protein
MLPKHAKRNTILLALAAILAVGTYLIFSRFVYRIGFPLDDAWIHQTFARNLIKLGEWSFVPGTLTAGSTSPLWTAILALGYVINSGPYIWTFLINTILLFLLGYLGEKVAKAIDPDYLSSFPVIGFFLIFEWHFVWASASGMETILFTVLCLLVFWVLLIQYKARWFIAGCLIGVAIWVRPEGITLFGVLLWVLISSGLNFRSLISNLGLVLLGLLVFIIPYAILNLSLSGMLFPNTFLAKQTEYSILLKENFFLRLGNLIVLPFIGVGVLLLPGFVYTIVHFIKKKNWKLLSFILWFIGFIFLYALRLPVTYQHGRYLIPTFSIPIVFGCLGTYSLLNRIKKLKLGRILEKAWRWSIYGVLAVFFLVGARTYATDVAIIETEMVAASKWIAVNTPPNSLIAAHDIGALGFFGNRPILDLAGLISPEVIPFMRDENHLDAYMKEKGAAYLMTFPDWYPSLVKGRIPIFSTNGSFSLAEGGTNMQVFDLENP